MKKLLPPVLVMIIVILMCAARIVVPGPVILSQPYNWLGLVLLVGGAALCLLGAMQFNKAGTNIPTFNEPTLLVTDGLFRWTRNPMYIGFTLFL
jgi:protein-S-isoprenylcysteine O-methyltransferase Ste14